jgi:hypothetical protein
MPAPKPCPTLAAVCKAFERATAAALKGDPGGPSWRPPVQKPARPGKRKG